MTEVAAAARSRHGGSKDSGAPLPRGSSGHSPRLKPGKPAAVRPIAAGVRHVEEEGARRNESHEAQSREGRRITEMVDDHAADQTAQRSPDALPGCNGSLSHIIAAGATHQIGQHERSEGAENACTDAVHELHRDKPE